MKDIVQKLEFGCPFKPGTIGEKDAERAEQWMEEGAKEITRLRAVNKGLLEALESLLELVPEMHGTTRKAEEHNAKVERAKNAIAHAKAKGQGGE